jgi:uncharacterized protein YdcH (DUF465 family)
VIAGHALPDCRAPDPAVSSRVDGLLVGGRLSTNELSKETLLAELTAEHRRLDELLQQLERRRALTPNERAEISRLKKQKLLTKDRITRLS